MKTIDLTLRLSNKIKPGLVANNIPFGNKVIQLITGLCNQTSIIVKKTCKVLEEYGSAATYAIHR